MQRQLGSPSRSVPLPPLPIPGAVRIAHILATQDAAEKWVRLLARASRAQVDWCMDGKLVCVILVNDVHNRINLEFAIQQNEAALRGTILKRFGLFDTDTPVMNYGTYS